MPVDWYHHSRALRCSIATAACLVLSGTPSFAQQAHDKSDVILSKLPARASAEYRALHNAAGKPAAQLLEMTKTEMWSIPKIHWKAFKRFAVRSGVQVKRLDANWNSAFLPMSEATKPSPRQRTMMKTMKSSPAVMGMSMKQVADPSVTELALTRGMNDTPQESQPAQLQLSLSKQTSIRVRRTSISPISGGYAWHGEVIETGEPVTLLWWPNGTISGTATYRGRMYSIQSIGGGMHGIVEFDTSAMPPEHAPVSREMGQRMDPKRDPLVTKGDASEMMHKSPEAPKSPPDSRPGRTETGPLEDTAGVALALPLPRVSMTAIAPHAGSRPASPVTIRVLVAYTAAAAKHYASIDTGLIALAIEHANQSFRNSGIGNVRLEIAHSYQTGYVEGGTHFDHVFRFADAGDGHMDEVHALRDKYAADIGLLIVHDPNGCGLAAEIFARPQRAFAVVHHECAANMYSLAHEVGHLIGARHDEGFDDGDQPFKYGHGYVHGAAWRTMMSHKDSCGGCVRLPLWSSPNVMVHGTPAGSDRSDNARVIAENAARIAGFR